jgi:hypothetical protein
MSEEEFILALVAIVFGIGLSGFFLYNIFSLIKAWINRKSGASSDINPQFFKALGEFKRNTERRLNNIEAIVSDIEEDKIRISDTSSASDITIEDEEVRGKDNSGKDDSNLRNMLNE